MHYTDSALHKFNSVSHSNNMKEEHSGDTLQICFLRKKESSHPLVSFFPPEIHLSRKSNQCTQQRYLSWKLRIKIQLCNSLSFQSRFSPFQDISFRPEQSNSIPVKCLKAFPDTYRSSKSRERNVFSKGFSALLTMETHWPHLSYLLPLPGRPAAPCSCLFQVRCHHRCT